MPDLPIDRVRRLVPTDTVDSLVELSGADLTTLLMEVARRRASHVRHPAVAQQYRSDRFVQPAPIDLAARNRVEAVILEVLPPHYEAFVLAPLVPAGTHAALASVHPDRVISTSRNTEVAGDPTVGLTLEAAVRRRLLLADDAKSTQRVHLASMQRITRAQRFDGPQSWAHFDAFGMITAGRDEGHEAFEVAALVEHVEILSQAIVAVGADSAIVSISDFTDGHLDRVVAGAMDKLDLGERVDVRRDPDRTAGRGYYQGVVFNVTARFGSDEIDVGDGGFVDWTKALVASQKERLMTSGLGVDRLAMALTELTTPE